MFISSFKWRNKIQNIIKKEKKYDKSLYLLKILDWEIFLNSLFWENFKEIRIGTGAEYWPQIGSIKSAEY